MSVLHDYQVDDSPAQFTPATSAVGVVTIPVARLARKVIVLRDTAGKPVAVRKPPASWPSQLPKAKQSPVEPHGRHAYVHGDMTVAELRAQLKLPPIPRRRFPIGALLGGLIAVVLAGALIAANVLAILQLLGVE